jgi:peptide/nickel transport system substrate-binding protein
MPLRALVIFALLLLMPWAPARAAKDELVIGMTQYPTTLHPRIESMLAKTYVLGFTLRPVTAYDKDWKLVCMLCTELPTLENGLAQLEDLPNGKKGVALTYTLQPKATWGDGTPVTAKDVAFTVEAGRNPQSGFGDTEVFKRILAVDITGEKTFVVHFDRVTFDYNALAIEPLPSHLEKPLFDQGATEYRTRTLYDTATTNAGLYFGPYRIVDVSRGAHIVMERNPTWYGPTPYFKRIVIKTIENTAALEANLLSGSIDYIAGEMGLSLDQGVAFEKRHPGQFNISYKPGLVFEHIDMNLSSPLLSDKRVRQALLYGLDRQAMSRQLFDGRQPVAESNVNPLDWVYSTDVPHYPYDPKAAAALLDQAGWTLQGAVRRNAKGEPLVLELMSTAGNRTRELIEQVIQSQWKALGIETRIRNEPARVFFGDSVTRRKFSHMALFAWIGSPESVPRTTLHSASIPSEANNWTGQNYTGYTSARMDQLIDAIETELDKGKRKVLWAEMQKLYAEDLPALPLFFRADVYILPKWLKGIEPTGHQFGTTLWVEQWRAE